jgi:hypothetical protein
MGKFFKAIAILAFTSLVIVLVVSTSGNQGAGRKIVGYPKHNLVN